MSSTQFDLRSYQPGDETAILDLFQRSFGQPLSLAFWTWRFQNNPTAGPMIDLAWDGDTLAAHYAVSPVTVSVAGQACLTALSMTTMTHPAYRGRGLFTLLANSLYAKMARQGYLMVWGFPNDLSHRGFVRDLAWQDIYEIPLFRLDLSTLRYAPTVSEHIVRLENFDERFDTLWEMAQPDCEVLVKRGCNYLRWRFSLHPHNTYHILGYAQGEQLLGYAVFKHYQDGLDIVDMLIVREESVGVELVQAVLDYCRQNDVKNVNTWLPLRHPLHLHLEKLGFRNTHPVTYLGGRLLNQLPGELDVTDVRRWYYTMGDSDVF